MTKQVKSESWMIRFTILHVILFLAFSVLVAALYGFWPFMFWLFGSQAGLLYGTVQGYRKVEYWGDDE